MVGQAIWCLAHTLWIGSSFMVGAGAGSGRPPPRLLLRLLLCCSPASHPLLRSLS